MKTPIPTYPSPPTSPLEVLVRVDELLCDESRWCFGDLAQSDRGNSVKTSSRLAVCFCISGAIKRVTWRNRLRDAASEFINRVTGNSEVTTFNDARSTTFPMVKDVLARAIEIAKAEASPAAEGVR